MRFVHCVGVVLMTVALAGCAQRMTHERLLAHASAMQKEEAAYKKAQEDRLRASYEVEAARKYPEQLQGTRQCVLKNDYVTSPVQDVAEGCFDSLFSSDGQSFRNKRKVIDAVVVELSPHFQQKNEEHEAYKVELRKQQAEVARQKEIERQAAQKHAYDNSIQSLIE